MLGIYFPVLRKYVMKPKFAYLYVSFIVSLAILVILSFLFYKRLNSHLKYSRQFDDNYSVMVQLNGLEERMLEMESHSTAFALARDSSFLPLFETSRDSVQRRLADLQLIIADKSDQMRRFLLMKSTINTQMNLYARMIERAAQNDNASVHLSLMRAKDMMSVFRQEARQIEAAEQTRKNELLNTKEFFEDFYPSYFNIISIFAGLITLVSFFFINREVRMRSRYQNELEKRLQELNRSNSELQQFAYIASHDLQEPLRKIRTFSDKLVFKALENFDGETRLVISRIEASAHRMQELIRDMTNFTNLITREDRMTTVELNEVVTQVLADFIDITSARHAVVTWERLPAITGNPTQLEMLFKSLFDNAFKFAKPGEAPVIRITYELVAGSDENDEQLRNRSFHKITMEDHGIGFNNEFAEKIFMIFQRLHTQQSGYRGRGIGLAIAQRIVSNHHGVIMARGKVNDGAAFIMYFPMEAV